MPLYDFRNKDTGDIAEYGMPMSEYDQFCQNNPNLERVYTKAPGIVDPIRAGITKPHSGLTEKLKALKKAHKGSTIDV